MRSRLRITLALAGILVVCVVGYFVKSGGEAEPGVPGAGSGMRVVALSQLPPEVGATVRLIDKGGPFPYPQDGGEFQNREGVLPHEPPRYYREYTVDTPNSADRGARRLIQGSGKELYYTADHYASFVVVDPER